MKLIWTIKVYETRNFPDNFKVKIQGAPYGVDSPHVFGEGRGKNHDSAYQAALDSIRSGTKPEIESIPPA